jgi:hypothetical protein
MELTLHSWIGFKIANSIGFSFSQTTKPIVFWMNREDQPVSVIASGANQIDKRWVTDRAEGEISYVESSYNHLRTSFSNEVATDLNLLNPLLASSNKDLLVCDEIWNAAGNPKAIFTIKGNEQATIKGGLEIQITGMG